MQHVSSRYVQSRPVSLRAATHILPSARDRFRCSAARLEFVRGIEEPTVPEVKLSRSRTGASGTALFIFDSPSIFSAGGESGDITGLFMSDDEGVLSTTDVKAKFSNGKPQCIEARYQMKSQFEWDRFIRFMDKYAAEKGLGLEK